MTPDRWEQLAKLFSEALEREGPDRDKFLKAACEGDAELCEQARRLLANHERAGDFLSDPAVTLREADEPAPLFDIDQVIAGRFRIVRFIARGGMGEVYEAEDLALNTRLALKTIRRNLAGEPGLALFKQEIQSARKVTHPNVCRIYDIAEHGDPPVMLLTMELLDGPTLSRHLREHGPFSRREALPLIALIAAGLQAAHDAGVIHRDFKSGNIILAPAPGGWRPVITDFGLALPAGSEAEHSGRRAGTPGYMAPEQREGGPTTPATDVYALGVVIARMTGASEPSGSRGSSSPADPPHDVSAERRKLGPWTGVVQRCLETEPAKRFQRPAEVAAALRRASALRPRVLVALAAVLACLAAFIWLNGRAGRQQTVDRQVSADAGVGYFSVSKDGRYLVYGDGKTGNLAVRDLRRNTTRVLASRQRGPGGGPASGLISPDNNQVAYRWHYENNAPWELCIVPLAGGASRVLLRGEEAGAIQPLAWSRDSKDLLAARASPGSGRQLIWVSAASGSVRVLRSVEWFPAVASVSPDGRYVAYDRSEGIFVLAVDSGKETEAVRNPSTKLPPPALGGASPIYPTWSSDGSRILFLSTRTGEPALWAIRVDAGKPVGEPELIRAGFDRFYPLGMTRNGALYYETGGSRDNVFVAEVNRDLTTDRRHGGEVEEFVNFNSSASWSPDGESLAYISRRMHTNTLVVQSWKTRESRGVPIGISPYSDTPVIWFPDGLSVLVTGTEPAKDGKRPNGFYRVNLAHGETQLVHPQACAYYDLSRTGEVLYYVQSNPVTHKWAGQLTRFDIQTGVDTALKRTEAGQLITSVAVSPDGKQLAYILRNDNTRESSLEVMPSSGGDSRELFRGPWEGPSTAAGIAWSSDQRYLLFVRGVSAPGGSEVSVYRIPAAGGDPVNTGITLHGSYMATMKFPSISPDGLRIAYQTHEDFEEVRVLENFLPRIAAR